MVNQHAFKCSAKEEHWNKVCVWLAVNFVWLVTGNYSLSKIVQALLGGGGLQWQRQERFGVLAREVEKCGRFTVTRQLS